MSGIGQPYEPSQVRRPRRGRARRASRGSAPLLGGRGAREFQLAGELDANAGQVNYGIYSDEVYAELEAFALRGRVQAPDA